MSKMISLKNCRLHNLKNIDVNIPLGKISVVCGPSGCGKSSLVVDTIHGESKRRYLETLSPFAADLLGGKRTIPIDNADNLPASLAIGPSYGESSLKSYALSIAEIDNALITLFSLFAKPSCPICKNPMDFYTREDIIKKISEKESGTKIQFLAPIHTQNNTIDKLSSIFLSQGFTRAIADGKIISLPDLQPEEKSIKPKEFYIITDRIIVRENIRTRIAEAVDSTLKLTHSLIVLDILGKPEIFSTEPMCKNANDETHIHSNMSSTISILNTKSFSPYNKLSACEYCKGSGFDNLDDYTQICKKCNGLRLKEPYLNACINNISFKNILETNFENLSSLLHTIFDKKINESLKPTFNTLLDRINAINELGIGYLTCGRSGKTLSGGEIQRLRLASLSTGYLNGLLIVLDEPASGLHITDVNALWNVLEKVKNRGNTLILIEHNPLIIKKADYIIEMGVGAGENGGKILFQGNVNEILNNINSPTANWIKELNKGFIRSIKNNCKKYIEVNNFSLYDMVPINAKFPINKFSVITGQSGSGKSTLLFQNIAKRAKSGEFNSIGIEDVLSLSTGDFHGNRKSTILSAIDLSSKLRDLFSKLPESKIRGYSSTKFSTHTPGGRCENCKGEGIVYFQSGYNETECPICQGKRFRDEILEIRFKSFSIADILNMEIGYAYKIFSNLKPFTEKLKPLIDTGLDYLHLGESTGKLSSGERARLRLSIILSKAKTPNTLFLMDEPARGLHQKDIQLLLNLIKNLCQLNHTVIAIEHSKDFVNAADFCLELKRK